jgi:predicted NAD/FAD-binding protein
MNPHGTQLDTSNQMKKVAVIGSGIAGMACAWFLRKTHAITLYEKNHYIGGHTNTVSVYEGDHEIPIDTGFMVFNKFTYPNLIRLFDQLGVVAVDTDMSFGVQVKERNLEYASSNANTFFAQRRQLFNVRHWHLISEIKRFFASATASLEVESNVALTLGAFLDNGKYSKAFIYDFLLPMTGAIWSTPPEGMLAYPASTLFRFMKNHGLLGIGTQFKWRTLRGGSRTYRDALIQNIGPHFKVREGAASVRRLSSGAEVKSLNGKIDTYDSVVIATHADEALALIDQPSAVERDLLGSFTYNVNPAMLHSDASVMPQQKRAWASWNYRVAGSEPKAFASTHYWMNSLQPLNAKQNYFVSLDYEGKINPDKIHWQTVYTHPRFDAAAIQAQLSLPQLNENGSVYYCGSYFKYGFHEDALSSAIQVVKRILGKDVWSI